jgi:hypothetical protein
LKCYVCAASGSDTNAIGICTNCGAGLCAEHRLEQPIGPGGTTIGCRHRNPDDERRAA